MPVAEWAPLPPEQAAKLSDAPVVTRLQRTWKMPDPPVSDAASVQFWVEPGPKVAAFGPFTISAGFVLSIVTTTAAVVAELSASSIAVAVTGAAPSATVVVLTLAAYGADASLPTRTPRTRNSTRSTPTLSPAVASSESVPATGPVPPGLVSATVGFVASRKTAVVAVVARNRDGAGRRARAQQAPVQRSKTKPGAGSAVTLAKAGMHGSLGLALVDVGLRADA